MVNFEIKGFFKTFSGIQNYTKNPSIKPYLQIQTMYQNIKSIQEL